MNSLNSIMTIASIPINAAPGSASAQEGDVQSTQTAGFASLLLGIITGIQAELGSSAKLAPQLEHQAAALITPIQSAELVNEADQEDQEDKEDKQPLEDMLEQLLQIIDSMPPEWKQRLASWAPAQQWAAAANVELAIATGNLTPESEPVELLTRLSKMLPEEAADSPMRTVAKDAAKLMKGFLEAVHITVKSQSSESAGTRPQPTTHLAVMEAKAAPVRLAILPEQQLSGQGGASGDRQALEGIDMLAAAADNGKPAVPVAVSKSGDFPQRMQAAAFSEEMAKLIMKQAAASGTNGSVTEAKISLMPEHLGQLEVKLTVHNGQVTAVFTTESPMAKNVLEANLAMLRMNLQNQGVQVDRLEVSQQAALGSGMFQEGRKRQSEQQESKQNKGRSIVRAEEWTAIASELEEVGEHRVRTYGSSFHATA